MWTFIVILVDQNQTTSCDRWTIKFTLCESCQGFSRGGRDLRWQLTSHCYCRLVVIRVIQNSDVYHFICDFISDQCIYLFENQDSILTPNIICISLCLRLSAWNVVSKTVVTDKIERPNMCTVCSTDRLWIL